MCYSLAHRAHDGRTSLGNHHLLAPARLVDDFEELGLGLVDIDLDHRYGVVLS